MIHSYFITKNYSKVKKVFCTIFVTMIGVLILCAQPKSDRIFANKFQNEKFPYGIGNFGFGRAGDNRYVEMRIAIAGALLPTADNPMRWSPSITFQANQVLDRGASGYFSIRGSFLGFGFRTGKHSILQVATPVGYSDSGSSDNASLGGSLTFLSPKFIGHFEAGAMLNHRNLYLDGYLTYHLWRSRNDLWFDIGASCTSNHFIGTRTSIDFAIGWGQGGIRISGGPILGLPNSNSEVGNTTTGFVTIGVFGSNF